MYQIKSPPPIHRSSFSVRKLAHLGALGVFLVAVIDSTVIPLPIPGSTDLLLLWLIAHNRNPWALGACAIAGSLIGGYITWQMGKKGGQAALRRYVPPRLFRRVVAWVERHSILSIFLPAILPPPIPLSPFILAAGALGVSRARFLLVFGAARTLRYTIIAWLAVLYGRKIVRLWSGTLQRWSAPMLWLFAAALVAGACYGIYKFRQQRNVELA